MANFGFVRVAAVTPDFTLGDPRCAAKEIIRLVREYSQKGARLIVFPELSLVGYSAADLFNQPLVQDAAMEALIKIVDESVRIDAVIVVGMPLQIDGNLFNVAVVIERGSIKGIVPKKYIPNSNEFYEGRWFASADCLKRDQVKILGRFVPIGTNILFVSKWDETIIIGVEICEDLWVPVPPSSYAALAGATILVNLSASNEMVSKSEWRRDLVKNQSGRCIAGYVYVSAGPAESTTDIVFGGHCLIAENGGLLMENKRFQQVSNGIMADIDTQNLVQERIRTTSFAQSAHDLEGHIYRRVEIDLRPEIPEELLRPNPFFPFVPQDLTARDRACEEVFSIQVAGLSRKLKSIKQKMLARGMTGDPHVVIGLSGGLDSTLAYLAAVRAYQSMGYDVKNIHIYSMPYGKCTSRTTKSNARKLAKAMDIKLKEISIDKIVREVLASTGHDGITQDIEFENAQARSRTFILMQETNVYVPAIVIGTGDLSELALGWMTFNGDQMSHYNVNCGVPKTLVRYIVEWVAKTTVNVKLAKVLKAVLVTPVSPELTSVESGKISQKTEDIIGPYALHDFFLYHFVRRGFPPEKIVYLAILAFRSMYSPGEIIKWLRVFIGRFFDQQFKRLPMPEGPRVGLVDLSPRGSFRMVSEIQPQLWLDRLTDENLRKVLPSRFFISYKS